MSEPQDVVQDLALGAFRMVKAKGFELDFTPETLPLLDHYLAELVAGEDGEPDESSVAVVAPCAGAYFGEVCRRSLPGLAWTATPEEYEEWRMGRDDEALEFNPIGVVLEAIYRAPVEGWHGHFAVRPTMRAALDKALEDQGPVREDDYYRLAVRHEVLEQALRWLAH
ncbi:MAG: hypothetical protein AB7S26_38325 [Sandaracinaceae bacterium]